ncbi:16S rRNA m(2)G 1207 methyltransferase /23S rRNA m(2)G-1835 methyltransferase [Sediminihabitans luteus]|uniref:16S rRNA m(2)G 1207 methyltransferase /23S rRNA m(2)G-1835 methyltransferase n=1 Tax=Sediminihabitans luteus TaxID=1138585 RepID=A0A2M9CDE9_9CELL|nr:methyltransferase [Sediminihabitans luteus]PJJ69909.1 16S rRNA m(2)G 1207 methyltransferase /23S rRNA m(2)G-1835 methyltransferase [Sediminihabitans luteus]GII99229.1 16S RNA G1207 methylase RsmC [Sediminihabitans luteus]
MTSPALESVFAFVHRYPAAEDGTLVAVDATDRLLLDEAAADLAAAGPGEVVVVDDRYGALTLGAAAAHDLHEIRVHQDVLSGEIALARSAERAGLADRYSSHPLGPEAFVGARVVLLQLPRSLAALTEIAETIAASAHPDVVVYAGGRLKHMTRAMNDVLAASFEDVTASLARQKSRVLVARGLHPTAGAASDADDAARPAPSGPVTAHLAGIAVGRGKRIDLDVVAHGAAFAGAQLDLGTRFLLENLAPLDDARTAVDLGCGTGVLATAFALTHPEAQVVATDESDAAVRSAAATARVNRVRARVRVLRDDVGSQLDDASADVVLLNPPFHVGAALDTAAAHRMFDAAARLLRPGGELWAVWNSHLRYKPALSRAVGPTEVVAQNPKFTVTRSTRR